MRTVLRATVGVLQAVLPVGLIFVGGLAACLSLWVIPIILLQSNTSRIKIHQFSETSRRGGLYMQPLSQTLVAALVLMSVLTAMHPDHRVAAQWYLDLSSGVVLVQVAWYEIVFIFPINEEVASMESKLDEHYTMSEKDQKRLDELPRGWQKRHAVRAVLPFIAGCLTLMPLLSARHW